jgi:PAS domain S-box-containing protein
MDPQTRTEEDVYREQVRVLSEALPAAVSITDPDGAVLWTNPYWTRVTGLSFDQSVGQGWRASIHPDDLPAMAAAFADARRRSAAYEIEVRFRARAGDWRWFQLRMEPLLAGRRRRIQGWISVATDVTAKVRSTLELKESESRFRLIAENAPVGLWVSDDAGACAYANAQLRACWGVEDAAGLDWTEHVALEDRQGVRSVYAAAIVKRAGFALEARCRSPEGEIRNFSIEASPRFDASGVFLGMIGVNVDVTDARRAEHHHRLLINELNHRVKNTLATVQSLAHQTVAGGGTAEQVAQLLEGRLMALSAGHNVMNRENWEGAELGAILSEALRPFEDPGGFKIEMSGPSVRIGPQAALAVALAAHELATNAVKYGALSSPDGAVEVTWRFDSDGPIAFEWRERGGPAVKMPTHRGFGSRLLAGLAPDLGTDAALEFHRQGLVCRLAIPPAEPRDEPAPAP